MFSEGNIIPSEVRSRRSDLLLECDPKDSTKHATTHEYYFSLDNDEVSGEVGLLGVCEEHEFYTLLKNEPMKYISIGEFNLTAKSIMSGKFYLFINREERHNNLEITFRFGKDKAPVEIKFTEPVVDLEVVDQLRLNIDACYLLIIQQQLSKICISFQDLKMQKK